MTYPGLCCPVDLFEIDPFDVEPIDITPRTFDEDGYERGQRINGYDQCPRCELWWPCVEETDCWEESERVIQTRNGCFSEWRNVTMARLSIERMYNPYQETREAREATGWWGASVCDCGLLLITQPDGTAEAYDLAPE